MPEDLVARVSYIKGLAEGLALDGESKEGKLLLRMIDLLGDFAVEVEQLKDDYEELFEYAGALDEDLAELEDDFYADHDLPAGESLYEESFTVECPNCRELVEISDDLLHGEEPIKVSCPRCGEIIMIDDEDWDDDDFGELIEEVGEEEGPEKEE
ncbi:MAG: AraC family transcriptional regulator [Firmicutes bacterium]|nr:AraC family transcriptional regulator [Bacillota bacterium]